MDRVAQQKLLMEKLRQQQLEDKKKQEDACPHVQGCKGDKPWESKTSIVWHLFDNGIVRGFCTSCLKRFNPVPEDASIDKDFIVWYRKPSGNIMSGGGQPESIIQFQERILSHEAELQQLRYKLRPFRTKIAGFLKGLFKW